MADEPPSPAIAAANEAAQAVPPINPNPNPILQQFEINVCVTTPGQCNGANAAGFKDDEDSYIAAAQTLERLSPSTGVPMKTRVKDWPTKAKDAESAAPVASAAQETPSDGFVQSIRGRL
jgi:hypothetical protein